MALTMTHPENTGRDQAGRWRKGASGNRAGKPRGARHKATLAAETLLEGEAQALSRKAVELALRGDVSALRLCLDRIVPPRKDRPVYFELPKMQEAKDAVNASAAHRCSGRRGRPNTFRSSGIEQGRAFAELKKRAKEP